MASSYDGKDYKEENRCKNKCGPEVLPIFFFLSFIFMSQIYLKGLLKFQVISQFFPKLFISIINFLFFGCEHGGLSSPTRDQTYAPCSESTEF